MCADSQIKLFLLVLLAFNAVLGKPQKKDVDCYGENLTAYLEIPEKRNGIFILFVPAPGYMDAAGKTSQKGMGVFAHWQKEAVKLGYSTVQFDKLGTGVSSGRLNKREEESLLCTYTSLPKLTDVYSNKLILFTYGGGVEFIRYALGAMSAKRKNEKLIGIVQIAGMISTDFKIDTTIIPYLSLLGDTTMTTARIKKALLHKKIGGDTLSRFFIMDNVNVSLCLDQQDECRFKDAVYDVVFNWIQSRATAHYSWVEKIKIDKQSIEVRKIEKINLEKRTKKKTWGKINMGEYRKKKQQEKKEEQEKKKQEEIKKLQEMKEEQAKKKKAMEMKKAQDSTKNVPGDSNSIKTKP